MVLTPKLPKTSFILFFVFKIITASLFAQSTIYKKDSTLIDSIYSIALKNQHANPEEATKNFESVIEVINTLPRDTKNLQYFRSKQANAYRVLGSYAGMNDEAIKALEYQEKSLAIKRDIGERESQILNYQALASLWGNQEDYKRAGIASDSAYRIAKETQSKKHLSTAARGRAAFFKATQVADSANYYFKIAIETAKDAPSKIVTYAALDMYGRFLREQGKVKESLPYVNAFLEALKSNKDTIFFTSAYLSIGEMELSIGNPTKAIENFKKGIFYANKTNQRDELIDLYKGLSESYAENADYKNAYQTKTLFFDEYKRKRDTSSFRERAEVVLKNEYAIKKAVDSTNFVKQKLLDESELKRRANTKFWSVVTGLMLILSLITLYYFVQRKRAAEQALRNEYLSAQISEKTEEVNELLTETIQHIKSKEQIAENLEKLSQAEDGVSLKSIMVDLKASKADNAKLMLVKQNIEKVNFSFIKKLKNTHPSLTKTDVEICSFIRIGLSRKEIAALRNTSIEAIKSSRFRLKKKLQLSQDDSLDHYINTL